MKHTFRQFQNKLIRDCAKECGCTLKEAKFCFPDHIVRSRHGRECLDAAKENIILSRTVLDSLLPLQRYRIFHDVPNYLSLWKIETGNYYIEPEKRKLKKKLYFGLFYQ